MLLKGRIQTCFQSIAKEVVTDLFGVDNLKEE
jgi:hypothetical protein